MLAIHGDTNLISVESTVLQKAHLPCFFLEVIGPVRTEFFHPHLIREVIPVCINFIEQPIDQASRQSALTQFLGDSSRSLALIDSRLDEALHKTLIALQALIGQTANGLFSRVLQESARRKLANELSTPVLAASKKVHRLLARLKRACHTWVGFGTE